MRRTKTSLTPTLSRKRERGKSEAGAGENLKRERANVARYSARRKKKEPDVSIWKQIADLDRINAWNGGSMVEHLGMRVTEVGDDYLRGTMPVDARTKQPFGLLHGGASVALAESLGSLAGTMCVDATQQMAVGLDINANHVRAVTEGVVTGTARPLHIGRNTQVWEIRIEDEQGRLVCISRLTLAIVPRRSPRPV
jgi:1,4-dihydroxy-2-naphthoyl-CoA hydrolase